ncbi:hypothetical protein D9611_000552 [Ephemerocybe angulata]|uniref:Uncharacterized protein n=1 Tax=Ephemerocybe angulata TaxID=980116 RepID=A0A8H5BNK9_9AGAR|nr:hypothetical protein D9611_000552 [Tulosesus angulatus]
MSESSGRQAPPNNPAHGSMRDWIFGVDSRSAGTSSERWGSYGHAGSGNLCIFPLTPSHPTFHPPAALNDHGTLLGRRASAVHELRKPWSSAPIHGRWDVEGVVVAVRAGGTRCPSTTPPPPFRASQSYGVRV